MVNTTLGRSLLSTCRLKFSPNNSTLKKWKLAGLKECRQTSWLALAEELALERKKVLLPSSFLKELSFPRAPKATLSIPAPVPVPILISFPPRIRFLFLFPFPLPFGPRAEVETEAQVPQPSSSAKRLAETCQLCLSNLASKSRLEPPKTNLRRLPKLA